MNAIAPIPPGDNALAAMADDLAGKGWARADGWFGAELCAALREDALARFMAEEDAPAGVGREGDFTLDRSVRQCRLAWLDGGDPAQSAFLARAEALRLELNRRLYLGLLEFEACYAETTFAATMECTNPEWHIFFFYRGSSGGAPRPGA